MTRYFPARIRAVQRVQAPPHSPGITSPVPAPHDPGMCLCLLSRLSLAYCSRADLLCSPHSPFVHISVVTTRANRICCVTRIARCSSSAVTDPAAFAIGSVPVASERKFTKIAQVHGLACGRIAAHLDHIARNRHGPHPVPGEPRSRARAGKTPGQGLFSHNVRVQMH